MTTELYWIICDWLRDLIAGTQWEGHLYAVGGCCRDEVLGLPIHDLDLAVDLPNGGVKFSRWLEKRHLTTSRPTYFLRFGTAKLRLRRFPEEEIEIVQTRREQYTKETSACPEVCFGTIEDDCFRRDFTVNSLYRNITTGELTDITGLGIPDMRHGRLRTPLDPDETFHDDPVRILRGLRFANRFDWVIDSNVYEAMLRNIERLDIVSRERCHSELCKMLNGPDPVEMMNTLRSTGVLVKIIPPMSRITESPQLWQAAMDRLAQVVKADPDAPTRLRLTCLFADLAADPREAARTTRMVMTALRFDRPIVADVSFLVHYFRVKPQQLDNPRRVREMQNFATHPERIRLLTRLLGDLGESDLAAYIRRQSDLLQQQGHHGFNTLGKGTRYAAAAGEPKSNTTKRRRSHRGGRKHHSRKK